MIGGAILLALLAVVLPPEWAATRLVGPEAPHFERVVVGVWIWKALLLVHATALYAWARARKIARAGGRSAGAEHDRRPVDPGRDDPGPTDLASAPDEAGAGPPGRAVAAVAVGAFLLVGLLLRLVELDAGLWFDEIKTQVRYVSQPLGWIVGTYDDQNQHVLYSILARLTSLSLGEGAFALRLPAVLLGVASLWAVYRFGVEVVGRTEAILAAGLLTVSYHHVWFSQNARGYTGLLLWTLLASAFFLRLLRNPLPRRWGLAVGYATCMALALYTHVTAAALAVAHAAIGAWWLWGPWSAAHGAKRLSSAAGPLLVGLILAGTLSLQLYAIVLPQMAEVLLEPSFSGLDIVWKNPFWFVRETLSGLGQGIPGGLIVLGASAAVAAAVGLIGLTSLVRRSPAAAATMTLPAVVTAAVIFVLGHNLWPRFFFFSAGFAVLIGLRGVFAISRSAFPRRPLAVGVAVAALGAAASATTVPAAWAMKQDYLGAEAFIDEQDTVGDAVVMLDMAILPYQEYRLRDWLVVENAEDLVGVEKEHARTWLVYTFPTRLEALHPDVWERMQAEYREAARFPATVRGGDIVVMVRE